MRGLTMKREEQIISEAKKHHYDSINCYNAFLHGVEWADEHPANVWHEAKEKPRSKECILVQFEEDIYETLTFSESGVNTWLNIWVDGCRAIRWAYISDLLPKQFGNK